MNLIPVSLKWHRECLWIRRFIGRLIYTDYLFSLSMSQWIIPIYLLHEPRNYFILSFEDDEEVGVRLKLRLPLCYNFVIWIVGRESIWEVPNHGQFNRYCKACARIQCEPGIYSRSASNSFTFRFLHHGWAKNEGSLSCRVVNEGREAEDDRSEI